MATICTEPSRATHNGSTQACNRPTQGYNIAPGGASTGTHAVMPTDQNCSLVLEKGHEQPRRYNLPPLRRKGHAIPLPVRGENGNNSDGSFCYGCYSGETMNQVMGHFVQRAAIRRRAELRGAGRQQLPI